VHLLTEHPGAWGPCADHPSLGVALEQRERLVLPYAQEHLQGDESGVDVRQPEANPGHQLVQHLDPGYLDVVQCDHRVVVRVGHNALALMLVWGGIGQNGVWVPSLQAIRLLYGVVVVAVWVDWVVVALHFRCISLITNLRLGLSWVDRF
jgi:hypothetical protein